MRKILAGAVLAAVAAAPQARAQRVRGALTDSATREPVGGAVVTLTDSAGTFLSRTIADAAGKFSIMRLPASRRMHVIRIGYRPRDVAIAAEDSVVDLRMQPVAALLGAITASGTRVCSARSASGDALELWEQARAGLLASVVSREAAPPRIRLRSYRRTLDPVLRTSVADTIDYRDVVVDRSFVAARAPWAFAEYGYVREANDGSREYFAPDEAVLLDATFAATHCLHVVDGRGPRAGQVGIAFEPVRDQARDTGDDLPVEVSGVLWLARGTLQLHDLEYRYTNLEPAARGAGGEIGFVVMPTGVPMIERWVIHTPVLVYDVGPPSELARRPVPRPDRRNARVFSYRETGGQVAVADWSDGAHWRSSLPHLSGIVVDLAGRPVPRATVWLRGTPDTTRADADGRFELPPVAPGMYAVMASDSVLAREGIARAPGMLSLVFADTAPTVKLELYPRSAAFELVCPRRSYKPGTGVFLARVVDSHGTPVAGAEVHVETRQLVVGQDSAALSQVRVGETGDDGRFVVCGVSHERPLVVRAFNGNEAGGVAVERWGDEFLAVAIPLRRVAP